MDSKQLEVIQDCEGCGVCCMHMGYPAFMLPREPFAESQLNSDTTCLSMLKEGWTREELLDGFEGESYWHSLPADLKKKWQAFVDGYQRQGELDGPCIWFDQDSRNCIHHEYRPAVCRDFEIGSKPCRQWRAHYRDKILKS